MLGLFRRWMFIIVGLAVVVTSVAAWFTSSWYCEEHVKTMLNEGFADAARAIEHNSIRLRSLSELSLHTAAVQAAMLDQLLSQKPELLYGKGKLELLAKLVDAQGIDVLDAHKTVIASSDQNLVGRRLVAASEPWGLEPDFGKFLANNATRSRASRGISDDDDGFLLYYYIPRRNRPGAIRLTYQTSQLRIFRALADLRSLSTSITVGENGGVDILREGVVVSSSLESAVGSPVTSLYSTLSLRSEGQMQCIERAGRRCIFATKKWGQYVLVAYLPEQAAYGTRNWSFGALIVANVIVFVAVYLVVTSLVRRKVVDGIKRVNHSLAEITAGNLDSHVEEHSSPEFISLSAGINCTVQSLRESVAKEAKRVSEQLELARVIQLSCLPHNFPVYPQEHRLNAVAFTQPAMEVGGDFYDFFRISEHTYGFVIADVSNHGIPAALYMMRAMGRIRNAMRSGRMLANEVNTINTSLCEQNVGEMFVSAFFAVLNVATGRLEYVNAGHNPPLWHTKSGTWQPLAGRHGLVLAAMPDSRYQSEVVQLREGDRLFLYTDGLTELRNSQDQMLGCKGLVEFLQKQMRDDPRTSRLCSLVRTYVGEYGHGVEQADDITVMAVEYLGDSGQDTVLCVPAKTEYLDNVQQFVLSRLPVDADAPKMQAHICIVVEELFVNICHYAYEDPGEGLVAVRAELVDEVLVVFFVDGGQPFNPLTRPMPNLSAPVEDRDPGGLGVYLAQKFTDSLEYRFSEGNNILRFTKRL